MEIVAKWNWRGLTESKVIASSAISQATFCLSSERPTCRDPRRQVITLVAGGHGFLADCPLKLSAEV